ncbi:HelD family protein [Brachybacterium saurashtrense]|uniref:DNA helicase n=1 Tax=Brachybacterium saurashtrense TaxID=556288 RepID=A0A345YL19_9MICO|nr:AAA family ATPase [Brachybacterium saurashtrense]AXK44621.1 DNA helicase [Brachybacterium saurashtrense]RRR23233.1 DNA helicase [Brachybacterium saurashtrense]
MDDAEGQIAREIAREQEYADRLYRRLDELIAHVERNLEQIQGSQSASTHQNRSERDSFMALYEDRLALLRSVSRSVVFGRLDMDDAARHYIGRIGLFTPEREQLLVDWRAPAAAAFYRATSTERLSVTLRRHLISRGRTVVGLEDDVLDQSLLEDPAHDVVLQGEGALLAAVSGKRTGRMGDIVATIQAEQDRIIRSENRGVLVVQGGPGTGKTAVALHRAAYLLYTHRRRLEHTGVLIMAPTTGFLRYIERVLPSLGESGVVMLTPGELFPGIRTFTHDEDAVARVKGDVAMAELIARAVKQRQRVPEKDLALRIDGTSLTLTREDVRAARREARASHKPHNAARAVFVRAALDRLVQRYEQALRAQGSTIIPEDRPDLLADLRHDPEVRRVLNLAWLPYTPQGFLRILLSRPDRLRAAAPRSLAEHVDLLVRPKDAPWTVEDIPLLDEVAELLGEDDAPAAAKARDDADRRRADVEYARKVIENIDTSGMIRAEDLADQVSQVRDGRTLAERASAERSWTYGHVVVDEAQEHSPMSWRALMRRAPTKSFTVVGDVAQTSSAAGTDSWTAALSPYIQDRLQVEHLTVNYRTPRRIMDRAVAMAQAHELPVTEVSSVRDGDREPSIERTAPTDLAARTVAAVASVHAERLGRVAVIAAEERLEELVTALRADETLPAIGQGSAGVDDEIAVMTAQDAKGLEFDAVVIVEPAELIDAHGAGDLYVAMSRPTQHLGVVHARELPRGVAG